MSRPALPAAGNPLAGITFTLVAMACFATLDTTTKYITASVPVVMAIWFRYLFQALLTTAVILPMGGLAGLRTAHPRFQLLRGCLLLTTSLLAYVSLRYMQVGEFTAIIMITPLVVTLLAASSLGEKVSPVRWALVSGGFIGTMVIIRPGAGAFQWATLMPLGMVVCNSWFQVLTSRMARTENPLTMHFYTGWIGTLLTSLALPFVWVHVSSWQMWAGMVMIGLMGTVGHFLFILAYKRAPASTLTPYLYAQIGFAMLGGWLVFSHVPDQWSMAGIVMIAVCGAAGGLLTVREGRLANLRVEAPEV